jgi:predicted tellurium resistance membrane protein TerC
MSQDSAKAAKARALVASLLFLEAGVVFALAGWLIVLTVTSDSLEFLPFLGVLLFALLGATGLAICARGYRRGKYFGRSPAVLANLIALGVVSYQVEAHLWFVAIPLAALAGTTLIAALRAIPTDL